MRILIYGAGVIGCELAHMLCRKNDVTILDADLEGYRVLQKLGIPILPAGDEKWFSGTKRPIMAAIFFVI